VIRFWATTFLFAALSSAGLGDTTIHATAAHPAVKGVKTVKAVKATKGMIHFAPADEYFGSSKMSLLGIRNQLHDLSLQYDMDHDAGKAIFDKAQRAEISLRDWAKRYPADPDIARHVYLLTHLYGKIDVDDAALRASKAQKWLLVGYPRSWYAKDEKKRVAAQKELAREQGRPQMAKTAAATTAATAAASATASRAAASPAVSAAASPAAGTGTPAP
jgi:hypothetical protein